MYKQHSLSRWLLTVPGLDTIIRIDNKTSLHCAAMFAAPLDILITLAKLSSRETVNMKTRGGYTALDWAVAGVVAFTGWGQSAGRITRKIRRSHCRPG